MKKIVKTILVTTRLAIATATAQACAKVYNKPLQLADTLR